VRIQYWPSVIQEIQSRLGGKAGAKQNCKERFHSCYSIAAQSNRSMKIV
jgi:hypothetical protein